MNPDYSESIPKTDWSKVNFSSPEIPDGCCDGGRCAKPVQKPATFAELLAMDQANRQRRQEAFERQPTIEPSHVPPGVEVVTSQPEPTGGHPGFERILDELWALHLRKGADYGTDVDCLANIRASKSHGVEPFRYAMLRADEKMTRYKSFVANGSLRNESLEDTLLDLASQAILALVLLRE